VISIRRIRTGEGELFRELRLASLKESPSAFSSTYDSAITRSAESWCEQADSAAAGTDRCTFWVFSDESPVGIASIYRNNDKREEGEIFQVWVAPYLRGTEVARDLLDVVLLWCIENGILKVFATLRPGNDRALKFYRKYGFDFANANPCDAPGTRVLVRELGHKQKPANG
jgi:ribosomal protein S18 acetylase RimI-like enzyme